jgi:hypothetical protein
MRAPTPEQRILQAFSGQAPTASYCLAMQKVVGSNPISRSEKRL